jgi:hypothetical protein
MTEVPLSIGGANGGALQAPQRAETVDNGTHPAAAAVGPTGFEQDLKHRSVGKIGAGTLRNKNR